MNRIAFGNPDVVFWVVWFRAVKWSALGNRTNASIHSEYAAVNAGAFVVRLPSSTKGASDIAGAS